MNPLKTSVYTLTTDIIIMLCACCPLSAAQAKAIYKWTDSTGTTHYSATPPSQQVKNLKTVQTQAWQKPQTSASTPTTTTEAQNSIDAEATAAPSAGVTTVPSPNSSNKSLASPTVENNIPKK